MIYVWLSLQIISIALVCGEPSGGTNINTMIMWYGMCAIIFVFSWGMTVDCENAELRRMHKLAHLAKVKALRQEKNIRKWDGEIIS